MVRDARLAQVGVLVVASLAVTACLAEDSGGDAASVDEGVAAGASQEEYIAAFEDVEPIELSTQLPGSPGDSSAVHIEAYAEALEEWSGGKITMEIAYGNAIAPPDQAPQALADGRLDFDYLYTVYDPSRYPANGGAFAGASFLGRHGPVDGTLEALAGYLEVGLSTPEIMEETESEGIKLLLPYGPTSSYGLMCTKARTGLQDLKGAQVRVGGPSFARQAEAVGMSPVSLPYSEIYQALQRGTIDCALQATWAAIPLGTIPLAPNYTIEAEVGFARLVFGLGFGLAQWEEMPLVAQQLVYDRLDVYLETMLKVTILDSMLTAAKTIEENDGAINEFDDDVNDALSKVNESMLDEVRESEVLDGAALVENLTAALDKWNGIIVDELGYPSIADDEFLEWYQKGEVDLGPYMDRLRDDVLSKHRPE